MLIYPPVRSPFRPYNTLSITGNFTLGDAHAWLRFCLPDVPEHIPVDEEAILYFKGVFTGTQLECSYKYAHYSYTMLHVYVLLDQFPVTVLIVSLEHVWLSMVSTSAMLTVSHLKSKQYCRRMIIPLSSMQTRLTCFQN